MDNLDLSSFFKTFGEARMFSVALTSLSQKLYEKDFSLDKALIEELGIQKKDKFMTMLRDNKIDIQSPHYIGEFISNLEQYVSSLPVLSLTIAFDPSEKTLETIAEWFPQNINKLVLLEVKVDRNLIAGATISFSGRYKDFSVRERFNQLLKNSLTISPGVSSDQEKPVVETSGHQSTEHISFGR